MINYSNATFVKSASKYSEAPGNTLPEVLICGKSNVGKSTLINTLTNHKRLAYTSSKPGHTKLLNYYNIDNKFYLVDAPGYGYANGGVDLDRIFGEMMNEYFSNVTPKLVLILIDSRRELTNNDVELINSVIELKIPFVFVFTKSDKINQKEKAKILAHIKEMGITEEYYFVSSLENKNIDSLKGKIEKSL